MPQPTSEVQPGYVPGPRPVRGTKRRFQDGDGDGPPSAANKRVRSYAGLPIVTAYLSAADRARFEDPDYEPPPPEISNEERFYHILLCCVTTHRAMRKKRENHKEACSLVKEADFVISNMHKAMEFANPSTDSDWAAHRYFEESLAKWEPILKTRQDVEISLNRQIEYLKHLLQVRFTELQSFPPLSRGGDTLECLAENAHFWDCFDRCKRHIRN